MGRCNDAVCVGLSQFEENDSVSSREQIAFPAAHKKLLALLIEMRKKELQRLKSPQKAHQNTTNLICEVVNF